jgi:hypothetical protein
MRRRLRADGYAMLAALVIVALAATITATCIAAVGARQTVAAADVSAAAARAALQDALNSACEQLRWAPGAHSGSRDGVYPPAGLWTATWRLGDPAPTGFRSITLDVRSSAGPSRGALRAVVEMRAEPCAQGVAVAGDVELRAPLRVIGSGVYTGGCLRGREWLSFGVEGAVALATDGVHPDVWPLATAHALGSIWADGEEIHTAGSTLPDSPWTGDSDTHSEERWPADLLVPPDPGLMCAWREHATTPGDALADGVLDLSLLPLHDPLRSTEAADPGGYIVLVAPEGDTALLIVGDRPADACPITLVVAGDAVLGRPGSSDTVGRGALVVTGRLEIQGSAHHVGHLSAGGLTVMAPTVIEAPSDWRAHPLPGLATPVIVALSEP